MLRYHQHPIITDDGGRAIAAFDQQWLYAGLRQAAQRSTWDGAWLLEDVARAVAAYFTQEGRYLNLRLSEFEAKIKEVLCRVGYGDLAAHFQAVPARQSISLLMFARSNSARNEQDFYARLRSSIHDFNRQGGQCLHLSDLGACVRELCRASDWFSWCSHREILQRVVKVIQQQLRRLSWPSPFYCSVT